VPARGLCALILFALAAVASMILPVSSASPAPVLPIVIRSDTPVSHRRASDRVVGRIADLSGRVVSGAVVLDTARLVLEGRGIEADSGASLLYIARGGNAVVRVTGPARLRADRRDRVTLERGRGLTAVRSGTRFHVTTASLVAGVRGTVFYTETDSAGGSYICICRGSVSVAVPGESTLVTAEHHEARRFRSGGRLEPAPMIGHTDTDVERILRDLR
jgi:hypothetical protein